MKTRSPLAFLLLLPAAATAAPDAVAEQEIAHLLDAVQASECTFVRNGTPHEAADARSHMELKYDHVRRRVDSAEDFVRYAGTESSMTGRPYLVECPGQPQRPSREWLLERLRFYRSSASGS